MSKATFNKIAEGLTEALAIARGESVASEDAPTGPKPLRKGDVIVLRDGRRSVTMKVMGVLWSRRRPVAR